MALLTKDDVASLIGERDRLCASLYMPTHRAGPETREDPIRFKNLLGLAEDRLEAAGMRTRDIEELLEPARALLGEREFWQHQNAGLAAFIAPGLLRHFRLPLPFEELAVVSKRFHIKPLLPALSGDGRFHVLAVSQNRVRLLQGSRYSTAEVDLKHAPKSLAEALQDEFPERHLQLHTGASSPNGGGPTGLFHGQGTAEEEHRDRILRYFRQVDKGLHEVLHKETTPLVLACVDYLYSVYREANTYAHLADEFVAGNPDRLSATELHDRAWRIVEPLFLSGRRRDTENYRQLAGTGRASDDPRQIVPAAHDGRVAALFVVRDAHRWGAYDPAAGTVEFHASGQVGDADLLDLAAAQTLSHGGTVYALDAGQMPNGASVAAAFRY